MEAFHDHESTTNSPGVMLEEWVLWVIIASAIVAFLVVLIAVVLIIFVCTRKRKKLERRKSDVVRYRVDAAFNSSLKLKGNELLREDYERYVKSDVSPLKDRQSLTRRESMTAAYDEVPYSPDDVKAPGLSLPRSNADNKRQRYSESRTKEVDSGNSSLASYAKDEPRDSLPNGTAYRHLQQSPSVECSEIDGPSGAVEPVANESKNGIVSGSTNLVEGDDRAALTSSEVMGPNESDSSPRAPGGQEIGVTQFSSSNSSFDQTDEDGITPL